MERNSIQTQEPCHVSTLCVIPFSERRAAAINKRKKRWQEQAKGHWKIKLLYGTTEEMLGESMDGFGAASQAEEAKTCKILWISEFSHFSIFTAASSSWSLEEVSVWTLRAELHCLGWVTKRQTMDLCNFQRPGRFGALLGYSSALLFTQGTYTLQGWLPTETRTSFLEPVARFVPVMVSAVPPACGPLSGFIPEG